MKWKLQYEKRLRGEFVLINKCLFNVTGAFQIS